MFDPNPGAQEHPSEDIHAASDTDPAGGALARQVGGSHYKNLAIQPIEFCHRNGLGPCESAIVKYISRWREKGGVEDLNKIVHYVELLKQLEGLS